MQSNVHNCKLRIGGTNWRPYEPRLVIEFTHGCLTLAGCVRRAGRQRWVIRFRGPIFPNYLFPFETAPHEDTALELGLTPHPTPWCSWSASPTPRRILAVLLDGRGLTDGRIWPRGWVAKMGVLQEISGEMCKIAETALHEDTALELGPTPHPTPWGGSPTPRHMLAVLLDGWGHTDGRIWPWGWVAKMGVLQKRFYHIPTMVSTLFFMKRSYSERGLYRIC
jgi:hypothetical protein